MDFEEPAFGHRVLESSAWRILDKRCVGCSGSAGSAGFGGVASDGAAKGGVDAEGESWTGCGERWGVDAAEGRGGGAALSDGGEALVLWGATAGGDGGGLGSAGWGEDLAGGDGWCGVERGALDR